MSFTAHERVGHSAAHSHTGQNWLELTWGWVPASLSSTEGIPECSLVGLTGIEEGKGSLGTPDELCLDWEARKPLPGELSVQRMDVWIQGS